MGGPDFRGSFSFMMLLGSSPPLLRTAGARCEHTALPLDPRSDQRPMLVAIARQRAQAIGARWLRPEGVGAQHRIGRVVVDRARYHDDRDAHPRGLPLQNT